MIVFSNLNWYQKHNKIPKIKISDSVQVVNVRKIFLSFKDTAHQNHCQRLPQILCSYSTYEYLNLQLIHQSKTQEKDMKGQSNNFPKLQYPPYPSDRQSWIQKKYVSPMFEKLKDEKIRLQSQYIHIHMNFIMPITKKLQIDVPEYGDVTHQQFRNRFLRWINEVIKKLGENYKEIKLNVQLTSKQKIFTFIFGNQKQSKTIYESLYGLVDRSGKPQSFEEQYNLKFKIP